jgi:hypothetical protein
LALFCKLFVSFENDTEELFFSPSLRPIVQR